MNWADVTWLDVLKGATIVVVFINMFVAVMSLVICSELARPPKKVMRLQTTLIVIMIAFLLATTFAIWKWE